MPPILQFFSRRPIISTIFVVAVIVTSSVIAIRNFTVPKSEPSSVVAENISSSISISLSNSISESSSSSTVPATIIEIDSTTIPSSSSSQSSQSTAVSSSATKPIIVTKPDNLNTYKNQFFPNFEINYSKDWKVDNAAKDSRYSGLVERELLFSRGDLNFQFKIEPVYPTGCALDGIQTKEVKELGGGVSRVQYIIGDNPKILNSYVKLVDSPFCSFGNIITSNIDSSEITEYKELYAKDDKVRYFFTINTRGTSESAKNELYNQLDQIVSQSKFQ